MKNVLISLHPEYWEKVLSGEKVLELRKSFPKENLGEHGVQANRFIVYVYETAPVSKVVGFFTCRFTDCYTPSELTSDIDIISEYSCVSKEDVFEYAGGQSLHVWDIYNPQAFVEPKTLSEFGLKFPPQSWCYVSAAREVQSPTESGNVESKGKALY